MPIDDPVKKLAEGAILVCEKCGNTIRLTSELAVQFITRNTWPRCHKQTMRLKTKREQEG